MDLELIMKEMDKLNYGWMDINNELHINSIDNIQKLYRLSSIEEILKNKAGICFDQVELERYIFKDYYETNSYALITRNMVHAFIMLEKDNQFIYFEHSSYKNKGIYYFNSKEDLLDYALKSFMDLHNIKDISKVKVVNYPELKPMTTFKEITDILFNYYDDFSINKNK